MACTNTTMDGSYLRIYINGDLVAKDTSSDLSIEHSTRETTSKTSGGWQRFTKGIKGFTLSGEALTQIASAPQTNGLEALFGYLESGAEVAIKLATPTAADGYFEGAAIINSLSVNSGNSGENVTHSYALQGTGSLEFKTI